MGRPKKYLTEEEQKAAKSRRNKRYSQKHKEELSEYMKIYRKKHSDERKEYMKQLRETPVGRASNLRTAYKRVDKKYNRGECTLTTKWIVENIFSSKCHYCGESDWTKLGADRIDNSKPHTPDNVVPCCYHCNCKKHLKTYEEFINKL